jgi:hypothetical protein
MSTTSQITLLIFLASALFHVVLGDLKITTASNPFNKDSNHQFRSSFTPSNESVIGYMIEFNLNNATFAELDPVVLQIAGQNYSVQILYNIAIC